MAPPQHMPMRPLTKVLTAHRRIAQQHMLPVMAHPLSPRHNTANEQIAVPMEHGIQQSITQVTNPAIQATRVATAHRIIAPVIITGIDRTINIPKRHIHPARRAARASNPMQVKQTQARIVRQIQL